MYLCIDTISSVAGITLVGDQFASYLPLDAKNSSEGIIATIDQALKDAKAKLAELKGVFVINGPGSFTGLRVGLSVANQFAHQLKIPIVGLRTDEWWGFRTDEKDFLYMQSMNREEAYVIGFGRWKGVTTQPIVSVLGHPPKVLNEGHPLWLGQMSDEHLKNRLPKNFKELTQLNSIEVTWQKVIKKFLNPDVPHKTYDLVEPFYGKEPNITKSKKKPLL